LAFTYWWRGTKAYGAAGSGGDSMRCDHCCTCLHRLTCSACRLRLRLPPDASEYPDHSNLHLLLTPPTQRKHRHRHASCAVV
jgi:hypothetical protein